MTVTLQTQQQKATLHGFQPKQPTTLPSQISRSFKNPSDAQVMMQINLMGFFEGGIQTLGYLNFPGVSHIRS